MKKTSVLLLLLTTFCCSIAQYVRFSDKVDFSILSIHPSTNNGFVVFGETAHWSPSYTDNYMARFDRDGNLMFKRHIGNEHMDTYPGTDNSFFYRATSKVTMEWFDIRQLDQDGNELWRKRMPYTGTQRNIVCEEGNKLVMIAPEKARRVVVYKLHPGTDRLDSTIITGLYLASVREVSRTNEGNYLFIGIDTGLISSPYNYKSYVILSNDSNILWQKELPKVQFVFSQGDIIYAFHADSVGREFRCTKYDQAGNLIATHNLFSGRIQRWKVTMPPLHRAFYHLVTFADSLGRPTNSVVMKKDAEMRQLWTYDLTEHPDCIVAAKCGMILLPDRVWQNDQDVRILKDQDVPDACIKCAGTLYPNPTTTGSFMLQSDDPEVFVHSISLYDQLGRLITNGSPQPESDFVSAADDMSEGIYICRIACDNGKEMIKKVLFSGVK